MSNVLIQSAFGVLSSAADPQVKYSDPLPSYSPSPEEMPTNPSLSGLSEEDLRAYYESAHDDGSGKIDPPSSEADTGLQTPPADSAGGTDKPAAPVSGDAPAAPVSGDAPAAPADAPAAPADAPAADATAADATAADATAADAGKAGAAAVPKSTAKATNK